MLPDLFGILHGTGPKALTDEIVTYFNSEKRLELLEAQSVYADAKFDHRRYLTELISFYHQTGQAA